MPQILIADDHPLFRAALVQALGADTGMQCAQAGTLDEALAALAAQPETDLVLLDLHMPGNHGLAGLVALRTEYPQVGVLIISANEDIRVIRRTLDHGAMGFIAKSASPEQIRIAVATVLRGERWLPPELHNAILHLRSRPQDTDLASRLARLSPQQFRVLSMVAEGLLNKQIADRLSIQERTVKAHLSVIFEKLGVRNRTQAGVVLRELALHDPVTHLRDSD